MKARFPQVLTTTLIGDKSSIRIMAKVRRRNLKLSAVLLLVVPFLISTAVAAAAGEEKLIFRADCRLSEELTGDGDREVIKDFLQLDETRFLLLSAGGRRHCFPVSSCPQTKSLWNQVNKDHPSSSFEDITFMATETTVKFPGFRMRNTVLNGCQQHFDSKSGMPVLTFCLIGDKKQLEGSLPVVWLVRKLTGIPKDHTIQPFQATETMAETKISIVPIEDGKSQLEMNIDFTTTVAFPKKLLKLLPTSKEQVEERGSESIIKVVRKDGSDALQAVEKLWLEYQEKAQSQQHVNSKKAMSNSFLLERIKTPFGLSRTNIRSPMSFKVK